jgi:hypothetical protein
MHNPDGILARDVGSPLYLVVLSAERSIRAFFSGSMA